jgi:pantoate--beta-alanine ligase
VDVFREKGYKIVREINRVDELQDWVRQEAKAARPRVLVPTMGGLHEGHLSLVDRARDWGKDKARVVVSIFVNPIQFGPGEDLDAYPRTLDRDRVLCEDSGVDLLFVPSAGEMYAKDASVVVSEGSLSAGLCGRSRPGHFDGVCTIVAKLFNLVQPQAAVFGEKDFQQLAIIRRMVRDLNYPLEVVSGPIVREPDGLAMSTRNQYLGREERRQALVLGEALRQAREALEDGERSAGGIRSLVEGCLANAPLARTDYVETVHPDTLEAIDEVDDALLVALAVFFGGTRLIDNLCWREEG